ncbi:hypothetical protein [Kitasatospora sp. NPDC085464]|uniref:hypothetical protein n=1 Tax=Kitasatospora sp. NPDC085464 TaxID=3364063 RepID=UPI0037CB5317
MSAFREPKAKDAASTMAVTGLTAITMFVGVTALAVIAKVHYVDNACQPTGSAVAAGRSPS